MGALGAGIDSRYTDDSRSVLTNGMRGVSIFTFALIGSDLIGTDCIHTTYVKRAFVNINTVEAVALEAFLASTVVTT